MISSRSLPAWEKSACSVFRRMKTRRCDAYPGNPGSASLSLYLSLNIRILMCLTRPGTLESRFSR